jgi:peptide/nickel transport system permease protein
LSQTADITDAPARPAYTARNGWGRWAARHHIAAMLLGRTAAGVVTLVVVSMLIFGAINVLPGDVAHVVLGKNATPAAVARIDHDLGLNRPLYVRYLSWAGGLLTGHLGNSTVAVALGTPNASAAGIIGPELRDSLVLALIAIVLLIPIALAVGALTAVRAGRAADHAISAVTLALGSMPEFLTGTILIVVFFTWMDALPPLSAIPPGGSPFDKPDILVLPVLTILAVNVAYTIRQVRATTIETLRQDFVMMARLNGYPERRVVWRYALRNSLAPSIQVLAQTLQYLIGGLVVVESVFDYPGIGNQLVQAVSTRDIQLVADITFILAGFTIALNIIADLIVVLIVPKLRTGSR